MHPTALEGFRRMIDAAFGPMVAMTQDRPIRALDVGGADVNGTVHTIVRQWFPVESIDVMDIESGSGVTIVADATDPATWRMLQRERENAKGGLYDLVITTETFEHVEAWGRIVHGAASVLRPGGWFIGTCASWDRRPHGARGAHNPEPGEHYDNVRADDLIAFLLGDFAGEVVVEYSRRPSFPTTNDLYWRAQKL